MVNSESQGTGVLDAPPTIQLSGDSTDYCCGQCGTLLAIADPGQLPDTLVIECNDCSSLNSSSSSRPHIKTPQSKTQQSFVGRYRAISPTLFRLRSTN